VNLLYKRFFKRLLDFIFSIVFFPVWGIIFIVVAPLIYFQDKGTIFYNAPRLGKNGKVFTMYKFRSMKMNAPDIRIDDGSTYNGKDDPRVTKIGNFLRKTSFDETPQLLNIIKGDMSIIGPRPDPPDWLDRYPEDAKVFLTVRPGVTGYSQAYFRNSVDGSEKIKNDVYYALKVSLPMDLKIFFKTAFVVFKGENTFKPAKNENKDGNTGQNSDGNNE
jgi:lipopolysaccharide/colanic/teichoic acid biosynthesis glycosyltransferase